MKIKMEMSEEEMCDFLQYRRDKANRKNLRDSLEIMASSALNAIAPDPDCPGKYRIADQDHADDLYNMAESIM